MPKRYAIVVEKAESDYAAYVPILPGCVATRAIVEETEQRLTEAIEVRVQELRDGGRDVPEPSSVIDYLEIPV